MLGSALMYETSQGLNINSCCSVIIVSIYSQFRKDIYYAALLIWNHIVQGYSDEGLTLGSTTVVNTRVSCTNNSKSSNEYYLRSWHYSQNTAYISLKANKTSINV
jgi:hypothetical protein